MAYWIVTTFCSKKNIECNISEVLAREKMFGLFVIDFQGWLNETGRKGTGYDLYNDPVLLGFVI